MTTMHEAAATVGDTNIRHIVNISGGKDSAALAIHISRRYPEIPAEYIFCDTHCELPETYDYLNKLSAVLDVEVHHVTVFDHIRVATKGRNAFEFVLKELYGGFLPGPRSRWCTRMLKIKAFESFIGDDKVFSYIGIRADEDRDGYQGKKPPVISERPNVIPIYPLKDDGIELQDVERMLDESGLGMPEYYRWRSRSGCYFCFYQQIAEWQGLKENHPELFEEAKKFEKDGYTWHEGRTLDEIAALPRYEMKRAKDGEGCAICHI